MRHLVPLAILASALASAPVALADCGADHGAASHAHGHDHARETADARPIDVVLASYEAIRQSLIEDVTDDVATNAKALRAAAISLRDDFSAERAGLAGDDPAAIKRAKDALPEIVTAAGTLVESSSLEDSREAFYALSKPLVRWHAGIDGARPVVAYCSMAEKSWLQPDEPLGNPYYGSSMLRCGNVVTR